MKKSLSVFSLILILAIVLIGCGKKPNSLNSDGTAQNDPGSPAARGQFDFPENFSSELDFASIKVLAQLDRSTGISISADEATLRRILTERNPGGDYEISVMPGTLLIRDRNSETYDRLVNLARLIPGEGNVDYTQNGATNNEDFRAWENLDGLPSAATVLGELKELFDAAGLKNLTPAEVYAIDAEALKDHEAKRAELFDQNRAEGVEPYEVYDWNKDDACYLVIYTCQIDGIPLYYRKNLSIGNLNIESRFIPMAYAYAFYGKDGLIGMEGYGLYEKGLTEGSDAPLSVEKIMDVYLAEMRRLIFVPGTKLTAMELCYLALPIGDYTDLVPIWAFDVTIPDPYPRSFVCLYDAYTGERCDLRYAGIVVPTLPPNEN